MTVYVKTNVAKHFTVKYIYPSRCFAVLHINRSLGLECDLSLIVCYIAPHSAAGSCQLGNEDVWEVLEEMPFLPASVDRR